MSPANAGDGAAYVVRSPSSLARVGAVVVAYPVLTGVVAGVLGGHWWLGPVALVATVLLSRSSLRAAWTPLRVDVHGISLSFPRAQRSGTGNPRGAESRFVAWAWVHRIEVVAATGVVRVIVRADAPLPPWQQGRIFDPADPEGGPVLEREVPGLDAAALRLAVLTVSASTPFSG